MHMHNYTLHHVYTEMQECFSCFLNFCHMIRIRVSDRVIVMVKLEIRM